MNLRSSWNPDHFLSRGPLTDRKIEAYRKRGFYSQAFRAARKESMDRKRKKQIEAEERRKGNFLLHEGRLIYSPR